MSPEDKRSDPAWLDSQLLAAVQDLQLLPELVTRSSFSGIHSSRGQGTDVEFAEHRHYEPGDDLRYLDWNALAKTDDLYLKQFESETRIQANLLLDASESMDFSTGSLSKWDMARVLTVLFSTLLLNQQDRVQLLLAGQSEQEFPPWKDRGAMQKALDVLQQTQPSGPTLVLSTAREFLRNRENRFLWILVSDFWVGDEQRLFKWIQEIKTRGHDCILCAVWDPLERTFQTSEALQLTDKETGETLLISPHQSEDFQQALKSYRQKLRRLSHRCRTAFWPFYTDRPLLKQVRHHLREHHRSS